MENVNDSKDMVYPHFLRNLPSGEDKFQGRSHELVAKAIAAQIINNQDCKMIGIDGGWGSGKSSLVEMVESALHEKNKYIVHVYDAWGHQTDHLRRSILEELADLANKLFDNDKWKNELKNLLAKHRESDIQVIPRLNVMLAVQALLMFLTPLIVSGVSYIPENHWLLKIIAGAFPYVVGLVWAGCVQWKNMKSRGSDINFSSFVSEMYMVYKDKVTNHTSYETISEDEPSTRQFREWMGKLSHDIKSAGKELIIVFDNMDRLPINKVQEIWATIHTLFAEEGFENVKVIVPFDRKHVNFAFKDENGNGNEDGIENKKEDIYGNDFINKTFYVVYRVSPPILSDWKMFFEEKWREAFGPDYTVNPSVTQIFDLLTKKQTPRKIIAFINEFVTVKQTLQEDIPDKYIALFILGKEAIMEDPIKEILQPSYLGPIDYIYVRDKDLPKYISALFYQLPSEKALDVVMMTEIRQALNNNDPNRLKELAVSPKFISVLNNAIVDIDNVSNAAFTLENLCEDKLIGEKRYQEAWDALIERTRKQDFSEYEPCQKVLLQNAGEKSDDYLRWLVDGYHNLPHGQWNVVNYVTGIDAWSNADESIWEYLESHKAKVEPELFIRLVQAKRDNYTAYGYEVDPQELDAYLANLDVDKLAKIDIIPTIKKNIGVYPKYNVRLHELITENNNAVAKLETLFKRLKELESSINHEELLSNQDLTDLIREVPSKSPFKIDLICMRLARFGQNSLATYDTELSNIDNDEYIESIAAKIEYYKDYGTLLINTGGSYNWALMLRKICNILTLKCRGNSNEPLSSLLSQLISLAENIGVTPAQLLENFNRWEVNDSQLSDQPENWSVELVAVFLEKRDLKLSQQCLTAIRKYYDNLSQSAWKSSILGKDKKYDMWIKYHPQKVQNLYDALKEVLNDYAKGSNANVDRMTINTILQTFKEVKLDLKTLFKEIAHTLSSSARPTTKLVYFSDWLLEYVDFSNEPDVFHDIFTTDVIDNNQISDSFAKYASKIKAINLTDNFKSKLDVMKDKYSPDFKKLVEEINGKKETD